VSLVERLEWDSTFFGLPIGRVREGVVAREIGAAAQEADELRLSCTYLLASADDDMLIDAAQENGFRVREVRVELERPVDGHPRAMGRLRRGHPGDLPRLAPIARERFRGTRFFADKGFPPDRSEGLYVEWLRRGLNDATERETLMAEDAAGFVVCHLDPNSRTGRIELIGVTADAAGRGLGSALVAGAGAVFEKASMRTAMVVTQGGNIAGQNLYQRHGYRTARTYLWLHRWPSVTTPAIADFSVGITASDEHQRAADR
jgi:dTDP-4-amino-4,6-dideoxy-D-galactose acyltransferase